MSPHGPDWMLGKLTLFLSWTSFQMSAPLNRTNIKPTKINLPWFRTDWIPALIFFFMYPQWGGKPTAVFPMR